MAAVDGLPAALGGPPASVRRLLQASRVERRVLPSSVWSDCWRLFGPRCARQCWRWCCSIARTEGVSLAMVRTDALRAAGLIFAAVTLGSLLKRKR